MIFTDEKGQEYELAPGVIEMRDYLTIRPKVEKQNYTITLGQTYWSMDKGTKPWLIHNASNFTPAQASAVAEAVKALIEFVQTRANPNSVELDTIGRLIKPAKKAREELNK